MNFFFPAEIKRKDRNQNLLNLEPKKWLHMYRSNNFGLTAISGVGLQPSEQLHEPSHAHLQLGELYHNSGLPFEGYEALGADNSGNPPL